MTFHPQLSDKSEIKFCDQTKPNEQKNIANSLSLTLSRTLKYHYVIPPDDVISQIVPQASIKTGIGQQRMIGST